MVGISFVKTVYVACILAALAPTNVQGIVGLSAILCSYDRCNECQYGYFYVADPLLHSYNYSMSRAIQCEAVAAELNKIDGISGFRCAGGSWSTYNYFFTTSKSQCDENARVLRFKGMENVQCREMYDTGKYMLHTYSKNLPRSNTCVSVAQKMTKMLVLSACNAVGEFMPGGESDDDNDVTHNVPAREYNGGTCKCTDPAAVGPVCQFSNDKTCSGDGVVNTAGECTCNQGAVQGAAGTFCYTDLKTCYGNGVAQADGTCACSDTSTGLHCQFSNKNNCNDAATVNPDGTCAQPCKLKLGHTGTRCEKCDAATHDLIEDRTTVPRVSACADLSDHSTCSEPIDVPIIQCLPKDSVAECVRGQRSVDTECTPCEANTYADGTRADGITSDGGLRVQCKPCPAGALSQPGSTSLNNCVASCQPGAYSANAACTACGASTYADDSDRRTTCKTCPDGSSNRLGGSTTITQCVCANDPDARDYFYISEDDKACNRCPLNEISVAGKATSAADCFAKYQIADGQRFCWGSGIDSRSALNVDSLAFALARVGANSDGLDEPWKSCEEAKNLTSPNSTFIHPDDLSCNDFRDDTCWDKTVRGDAPLPFGCVMKMDTKEIMYFSGGDAKLYYDGFDYVPVCERYVCPDNPDGDTEKPVELTKEAILLDTSRIPECRLSAVSVDAYNNEATKENNTVFIPVAVCLSILCMILAACLTRDNVKWQWIIFGVGMRTFDCQTDWGFYIINMRNKGFETIYTDGLIAGSVSVRKVFNSSLLGFQNVSLAFCIVGMLLTPLDVWGNRQRALGKPSLAMTISILILLLEDVPQLLFNIKFMYAMGSSDPVTILSLVASIGNIVYNLGLIFYELCQGYTPAAPACCKSNREAELEEMLRISGRENAALARKLNAMGKRLARYEGKRGSANMHTTTRTTNAMWDNSEYRA